MRVVSWNMGCGPRTKYRRTHREAWTYLLDELKPDFALVQEALLIADDWIAPAGKLMWSADKTSDSGTAVFVHGTEAFTIRDTRVSGSFVATISTQLFGSAACFASIHIGPSNYRAHLKSLRDWIATSLLPTGPFVIGGDFNSSRSIAKWHERYLTGLSDLGCFDCHWRMHGREVQSFWGHQAKTAYQDDHIFTSSEIGARISACGIIDTPEARRFSDHGPVVLEIGEAAAG